MDDEHGADEHRTTDEPGRRDLLGQWRNLLQQVTATTGRVSGGIGQVAAGLPGALHVPWPGALSAAQVAGVASAVRAQRSTIAGLQSQLVAFDQQLEVLEQLMEPLAEWTARWARIEGVVRGTPAGDESDEPADHPS